MRKSAEAAGVLVIAASQSPFEDVANSPRTTQGTSPAQILIHPYQSKNG
jgi:hypothetical protein